MRTDSEHLLPERVLQWVIDSVDPDATVIDVHRLYGGISTSVHSVSLRIEQTVRHYVLRQFDNAEWLQEETDLALHEAMSLQYAKKVGLPSPQLIAFVETGEKCGVPVLLMTKLEGAVDLKPENRINWLTEQARYLAQIHRVEADDFPWAYFSYMDINTFEIPTWSSHRDAWKTARNIVKERRPATHQVFIHRDYHPNNLLWSGDSISGIVDWVNACLGPAGVDVGHCRWNLTMLFGVEIADAFLEAYKSAAGAAFTYDPYWDLVSLIDVQFGQPTVYEGWPALGVTDLTDQLMVERTDEYLLSLLERVTKQRY